MKGRVDEKTGMVMNITDLKKAMNIAIMDTLDHKHIDLDVEYFKNVLLPTQYLMQVYFSQ